MIKTKRNPRIRFHLSEEFAAELNHVFRKSGCRSWDQFFGGLLARKNNDSKNDAQTVIQQKITSIENTIEKLVDQTAHFNLLLEGQIEALHNLNLSQEQLIALVNRLNGFLELAFELAGEKLTTVPQADHGESSDDDVIDKIRNHQFL